LEGSQAHFYYQLVSGSVRWVNINDEGKEFLQVLIEPGKVLENYLCLMTMFTLQLQLQTKSLLLFVYTFPLLNN
jgi:hypothetical protein